MSQKYSRKRAFSKHNSRGSNHSSSASSKKTRRTGSAPLGVCFHWWNHGSCPNEETSCTFQHCLVEPDSDSDNELSKITNEITALQDLVSAEIILCKKKALSELLGKKSATANPVKSFPEECRNLFYKKQNVNLFVKDSQVVWQFSYSRQIINAIKENVQGRKWNPNIGDKGCWTSPLEGLPDAIAFYEHMGRIPSPELVNRAKEIENSNRPFSPDAIKLLVKMSNQTAIQENSLDTSTVTVKFRYNADVVSALKMLSSMQREFDPIGKKWIIDLSALPNMIDLLEPLGYNPDKQLQDIVSLIKDIETLIHCNDDSEDEGDDCSRKKIDKTELLEKKLKLLATTVAKTKGKKKINKSDCGSEKKRRLTSAQLSWKAKQLDSDFEDDYAYDGYYEEYEEYPFG